MNFQWNLYVEPKGISEKTLNRESLQGVTIFFFLQKFKAVPYEIPGGQKT